MNGHYDIVVDRLDKSGYEVSVKQTTRLLKYQIFLVNLLNRTQNKN